MLNVGDTLPEFSLLRPDKELVTNQTVAGRKGVFVFMPFPFSPICQGEVCEIRDNIDAFASRGFDVYLVTVDTFFSNGAWAEHENLNYPVLSDFWPHGATAQAFGVFNEDVGVANRASFFFDENGVVTDVVATDALGEARSFDAYAAAIA